MEAVMMAEERIDRAKFYARCKACAKWVVFGSPAIRVPGGGVRHLDAEACAMARPDWRPMKPQPGSHGHWRELTRVGQAAQQHKWTFAKTMAKWPHEWTVRRQWQDDQLFVDLVTATRSIGRAGKWQTTRRDYLDINEHQYWVCSPETASPEDETLVNRAVVEWPSWEPRALTTTQIDYVLHLSGGVAGRSVLDFGGTMAASAKAAGQYLAVGPLADMKSLPRVPRVVATVASYVATSDQFATADLVAVMGGVADRLSEPELQRLPLLVRPGGMLVAQFLQPPATLLDAPWSHWAQGQVLTGASSTVVVVRG